MTQRRPIEMFPPGDFIKEELEARGWSQTELAEIMGRAPTDISTLVSGKRSISADMAKELGAAVATSAQYWMTLDSSYQLSKGGAADDAIGRRAKLREFAPIREMAKRHWLEVSENVSVTERRLKAFFCVENIDDEPSLPHAARRGAGDLSRSHLAWLFRARELSTMIQANTFSKGSFNSGLGELKKLLRAAKEVRHVPRILADAGIRFLVIEHLPKTKIDGVAFWLNKKSPVISMSLRYDRIDCFWYTLAHELGHVARKDGWLLDTGLVGQDIEDGVTDAEKHADHFAMDFLISQPDLEDFIARTSPLYSTRKVLGFAQRIGVHPGIVVGQLQYREEVLWSSLRSTLEKVRHLVTESALTDGWGHVPPVMG